MRIVAATIAGLLLSLGSASYAASFNCMKLHTRIEKLICSDQELSKLDDELASTYKLARQAPTDWEPIGVEVQKNWLNERNKCFNSTCLIKMYREQIDFWGVMAKSALAEPPITGIYQH